MGVALQAFRRKVYVGNLEGLIRNRCQKQAQTFYLIISIIILRRVEAENECLLFLGKQSAASLGFIIARARLASARIFQEICTLLLSVLCVFYSLVLLFGQRTELCAAACDKAALLL